MPSHSSRPCRWHLFVFSSSIPSFSTTAPSFSTTLSTISLLWMIATIFYPPRCLHHQSSGCFFSSPSKGTPVWPLTSPLDSPTYHKWNQGSISLTKHALPQCHPLTKWLRPQVFSYPTTSPSANLINSQFKVDPSPVKCIFPSSPLSPPSRPPSSLAWIIAASSWLVCFYLSPLFTHQLVLDTVPVTLLSEPASSVLRILQPLLIKLIWKASVFTGLAWPAIWLLVLSWALRPLLAPWSLLWPHWLRGCSVTMPNKLLSWVLRPCSSFYPECSSCQCVHSSSWLKACQNVTSKLTHLSKMASSSLFPPDSVFLNVTYFHLALLLFLLFWGSFGHAAWLVGSQFPWAGRESGCRQGKNQVLTTRLPGNSSSGIKIYIYSYIFMYLLIAFLLQ